MSFTNIVAKGDPVVGGRNLDLLVYPNEQRDRDPAENNVISALENSMDQLLNENSFDYYEINLYMSETDVNHIEGEDDGSTYFNNFATWVDNNFGGRKGVHLGVTSSTNFANAQFVGKGETAWVANTVAFVGTAGGYDVGDDDVERYKNLSVQEPLHNMISSEYNFVSDMTEGDEHDLGMITGAGSSTPMLTFYERDDTHPLFSHDRSGKGDCQQDSEFVIWAGTHTRTVTTCTEDAVSHSSNNET